MTNPLQLLLAVVIVTLTFLLGFVAFQTVQLIHEFRSTLRRLNQELDGNQPIKITPPPVRRPNRPPNPVVRRFFRRSGLPLRAS